MQDAGQSCILCETVFLLCSFSVFFFGAMCVCRKVRCTKKRIHTYSHTHIHTCTHAHIHTYTHTHIHTYTHTHIHTYTHTRTTPKEKNFSASMLCETVMFLTAKILTAKILADYCLSPLLVFSIPCLLFFSPVFFTTLPFFLQTKKRKHEA